MEWTCYWIHKSFKSKQLKFSMLITEISIYFLNDLSKLKPQEYLTRFKAYWNIIFLQNFKFILYKIYCEHEL